MHLFPANFMIMIFGRRNELHSSKNAKESKPGLKRVTKLAWRKSLRGSSEAHQRHFKTPNTDQYSPTKLSKMKPPIRAAILGLHI